MANTVFGPYAATNWVAGTTALNQTNMNHLEGQANIALHGFNPDEVGAGFVYSGCAVTGTVGTTTVNIASGVVYTVMTDGTVGRITVGATTQTTSALSSTYHLYVQPDGTFYWSTSNTPAANSIALANVATNGSGQISSISDQRSFNFTLWGGAVGKPTLPTLILTGASIINNDMTFQNGTNDTPGMQLLDQANNTTTTNDMQGERWRIFGSYRGGGSRELMFMDVQAGKLNLAVGGVAQVAGQSTAGSFGVPVIVAQAINTHVTATTQQTILTFTPPADGLYQCYGSFSYSNGSATHLWFYCSFTDPNVAGGPSALMHNETGAIFNLSVSSTAGTTSPCWSPAFYAKASNAISVIYQDNAGTPGDWVTAVLCRLS